MARIRPTSSGRLDALNRMYWVSACLGAPKDRRNPYFAWADYRGTPVKLGAGILALSFSKRGFLARTSSSPRSGGPTSAIARTSAAGSPARPGLLRSGPYRQSLLGPNLVPQHLTWGGPKSVETRWPGTGPASVVGSPRFRSGIYRTWSTLRRPWPRWTQS